MEPTEQTLSTGGESSTPATQPSQPSQDELVSTVDFKPAQPADADPEGANNTEAAGNGEKDGAATETAAPKGASTAEETRFDKHPRFVQLNDRLKAAEATNKQLAAQIEKIMAAAPQEKPAEAKAEKQLPFKDPAGMTDEEILDWQSEDPKGFFENLKKAVAYEFMADQEKRQEEARVQDVEAKVEQTYRNYAENNPDFDKMWDSGEIRAYMDENPGHNAISAHMAMTAETRQAKAIEDAVAKALKTAETARRSTRKTAAILGQGPSTVPTSPAASTEDLKNPKKFGGDTAVLAARLAERRRAAP